MLFFSEYQDADRIAATRSALLGQIYFRLWLYTNVPFLADKKFHFSFMDSFSFNGYSKQ